MTVTYQSLQAKIATLISATGVSNFDCLLCKIQDQVIRKKPYPCLTCWNHQIAIIYIKNIKILQETKLIYSVNYFCFISRYQEVKCQQGVLGKLLVKRKTCKCKEEKKK